jgi:hypothetical protein
MDKRCEYGVYSLRLKQKLLDNLQLEREERRIRDSVDTSTGLASRLDKVRFREIFFLSVLDQFGPNPLNHTLSQIFFNFRNICVSVAVFRHILQNILQCVTKDRDTFTYPGTGILRKLKIIWESV